jgi:hypothetical protein
LEDSFKKEYAKFSLLRLSDIEFPEEWYKGRDSAIEKIINEKSIMLKQLLNHIDFDIKTIPKYCGFAIIVAGISAYVAGTINPNPIYTEHSMAGILAGATLIVKPTAAPNIFKKLLDHLDKKSK